ncbi:MAG: hypothetical protein ACXAB5_05960, partial [Candidatus Thorarchaeota archaeon]
MSIQMQDFHWDKDFDSVRKFLGEIFFIQKSYTNWLPTTLENVKFGPGGTEYLDEEDEYLKIWKNGKQIVAFSVTKPSGSCHISIHPDYIAQTSEIVLWMQERVKELSDTNSVKMTLVVDDADEELIPILSDLGFKKDEV